MELRDGLELVYFITGGPVLALIGVYGLKQLKISKKIFLHVLRERV